MNNEDYVKIVYESAPIGKEKIVLRLTTFDLDKFKKDEKLKKIPKQEKVMCYTYDKEDLLNSNCIIKQINNMVNDIYKEQIEQMKSEIEFLRSIKIVPVNNARNISNSDDVHCDIVYGNISNCDNIYCHEIKGNVVNCNKIIYK